MNYAQATQLANRLGVEVVEDIDDNEDYHGICDHDGNLIRLRTRLPGDHLVHVLMHEIAHMTGSESRLNRDTLVNYNSNDLYLLVEELIAETVAVTLLKDSHKCVYKGFLSRLISECAQHGIEWDHDIEPEVKRILDYLEPFIREVHKCREC